MALDITAEAAHDITAEAAHDITAEAPEGSFACTGAAALGVCWVVLCVLVRGAAKIKKLRVFLGWPCLIFWQVCEYEYARHARVRTTRAVGGRGLCVRGQGDADRGCGSQGHVTRAVSDAPSDYGGIEHCRRVCGSTGADPNRAVPTNALQRGPLVWSRGRALHPAPWACRGRWIALR
jgi:hypothetical protein